MKHTILLLLFFGGTITSFTQNFGSGVVDIDSNSYTIDVNKLEEKIKLYHSNQKRVKTIIGVDFAGHPCDWTALRYIADKYDLKLINDNCHALGAEYNKKKKLCCYICRHSYSKFPSC